MALRRLCAPARTAACGRPQPARRRAKRAALDVVEKMLTRSAVLPLSCLCPYSSVGFGRRGYLACRARAVTGGGPRGSSAWPNSAHRRRAWRLRLASSDPVPERRKTLRRTTQASTPPRPDGADEGAARGCDWTAGRSSCGEPSDLVSANVRGAEGVPYECRRSTSDACSHGTFVAGILVARRGSDAPAICPGCTLLVYPVFLERGLAGAPTSTPTAADLASAIVESIDAGAKVLNLSLAVTHPSPAQRRELRAAMDHAARREVFVVAAVGNEGSLGGAPITSHPWAVPAVAYDIDGRPAVYSNLGLSIGKRGVGAPGEA